MRISQIYVDGYGVFRDFALDDISTTVSVILGPNEAGKTTLLSFIRTILFGFLDKRSAENLYEPLGGGRHGGRIGLVDAANGQFMLERYAGAKGGSVKLTLPDGSEGDTSDLAALLGHTSRDLFRNVFAFSLTELQDFATLSSDDVRARIYGAGIGAGRLGLPEIEKKIEQDRGELYREGGAKQTIAGLIRTADEVRGRLRELGGHVEEHDRLQSDLQRLDQEIATRTDERRACNDERDHIGNLQRGWGDWTDLRSAREQLKELPDVERFPPDGIMRLERLLQGRDNLRDRIEETRNQIAANQEELDQIDVNELVLVQSSRIAALNQGLEMYTSAKADLPKRESELDFAVDELQDGLKGLGPGWSEERVDTFDTSVPAREAVRAYGEKLRAAGDRLHDAERDAGRAGEDHEKAAAEQSRLEKEWKVLDEPPEPNRKVLEENRRKARELRGLLSAHEKSRQERDHIEDRKDSLETQVRWIERQVSRDAVSLPRSPTVLIPLVGLAIAAILAVLTNWIAAAVIAVVGVVVAAGYDRLRRGLAVGAQEGAFEDELRAVREQLKNIEEDAAAIASSIAEEENSTLSLARELGIDRKPETRDIDGLESKLEEALRSLEIWEAAKKQVADAAARVEQEQRRLGLANEDEVKETEEFQRATGEWHGWLEKRNMAATSPETCLELLSMAASLREKMKSISGLRKRIDRMREATEAFEKETDALRQACGLTGKAHTAAPGAVDQLVEASLEAKEGRKRVQQLGESIEREEAARNTLETRAQDLGKEIAGLLAEGDAADEEDFRRRDEIFREREGLLAAIKVHVKNLERISGPDRLEEFIGEWATVDPEENQQKERAAGERIDEIESELDERRDERAQIAERIRRIETEEESSELRLRQAVLQEKLRGEARKWSVLTIGQALLGETRLKYERERQPAVVQEAQRFFSGFTAGKYERIFSLPGENRVEVEDKTGKRKDTSELSRGTVEQLYLALRFGLVREFARRVESMPVIMDDILVNFDPKRAQKACKALDELSKHQQVLLFTCHPETVELVKSVANDCRVIELSPRTA